MYFFLFAIIKITQTIAAKNSAIAIDNQIPSTFIKIGKVHTRINWNTTVLKKEHIAEINPLFNAVKNDEPKIAIPANK